MKKSLIWSWLHVFFGGGAVIDVEFYIVFLHNKSRFTKMYVATKLHRSFYTDKRTSEGKVKLEKIDIWKHFKFLQIKSKITFLKTKNK